MSKEIHKELESITSYLTKQEKDKVVNSEGVKKIFEQWKGPKKIINNDTNLGGFNYHDIIGILNSPQDDFFVEEINSWIEVNS